MNSKGLFNESQKNGCKIYKEPTVKKINSLYKRKNIPKSCNECVYQIIIKNIILNTFLCKLNKNITDTKCVVSRANGCPLTK